MKASTKAKNGKLATRILAWILAILMVVSIAYFSIVMIVDNIRADQAQEDTTGGDDHEHEEEEEHDHDGDGVADH